MIYMTSRIVAIQGNHPSKLNPKNDTSIFLAVEAQNRKYKIFYYEPAHLSIINDKVIAYGIMLNSATQTKNFTQLIKDLN